MTARLVLSPLARADLDEIYEYSFEQWGLQKAEAYLTQFRSAVIAIAENPLSGQSCEDIRRGYRRVSVGSHVVFFRRRDNDVDIVRILHQAMDFTLHL